MESNSDVAPLVEYDRISTKSWWKRKGVIACFLGFLFIVIVILGVVIWYFSQYNNGILGHTLKIMALNVWGVPATFGAKDKTERMKAIGTRLQKREYDVYLLEELWMRGDHAVIKAMVPQGENKTFTCPAFAGEGNVHWLKEIGDFVLKGDPIYQVEGTRNIAVPSSEDGVLAQRFVVEGTAVTVETPVFNLTVGGYVMTEVGQLANSWCDGTIAPDGCSGLAVVSRFPFKQIHFQAYTDRGDALYKDGEYYARKGIGRVRIEPYRNSTVDIFVTHTCASDYNSYYRQKQVDELVGHLQKKSDADFTILGGDFNVDPRMSETSYHAIKKVMVNAIEDYFHTVEEWLTPSRATYANPSNTYSYTDSPVLYDYIFHKANGMNLIWTDLFEVPFLKTWLNSTEETNKTVSLSDHEAVTSHLRLYKYNPVDWVKDS